MFPICPAMIVHHFEIIHGMTGSSRPAQLVFSFIRQIAWKQDHLLLKADTETKP